MKKILIILLLFFASITTWAYDFQSGDLCYNITSDTVPYTVEITHRLASSGGYYFTTVSIPSKVNYDGKTYDVTSIGDSAFYRCTSLQYISIPNTINRIGNGSFSGCTSFYSISIPTSVTSIGEYAFYQCKLTSVIIPNSVTEIGESAFYKCESLTSVTLSSSLTTIEEHLFYYCTSLKSINIPNSVTAIKKYAFSQCESLRSIAFPDNLSSIGYRAFWSCKSISSIVIPHNIIEIGDEVFAFCSSITKMVVDKNNPMYDSRDNCNAIIYTTTNTLVSGCQKTIVPESITNIGNYAFEGCLYLTSITIPEKVIHIGKWAFANCVSLTSINIPKGVKHIEERTFFGCESLRSIDLPNTITSIGERSFEYCLSLNSISIPNTVTIIDDNAFHNCTSLSSITMPNSVLSIAGGVFRECKSLKSIVIPNKVNKIEAWTFAGCISLKNIMMHSGVDSIKDKAFDHCSTLNEIYCYATIPPNIYDSLVFSNYDATLYVPCKSISSYQSHEVWKQFSNIQCIGIDFLEIPYDATSFTEEERNSNPERIIYPATLEDKDSVDMICELVGGDCMEAVDLGLSVKWATCNVGASNPEDYGDYFAWGETEPKTENEEYYWSTYKWCNGSASTLTKYNNSSSYGTVDNKKTLELADDAARANWGGAWRMPTDAEMTELREQCTWTWTTLNGVNGYKVTGTNGNSIFLPAAGYRVYSSLSYAGSGGGYWSSSLFADTPYRAYSVDFSSSSVGRYDDDRIGGHSVRPVCH